MVSATILADGAARNVTDAAYAPGPAGAAVRAVGPSAAAACPAAIPAPAPRRAADGDQGRPGEELAAVHRTSHPALSKRRQARRPPGPVSGIVAVPQQHQPLHPPTREPLPRLLSRLTFSGRPALRLVPDGPGWPAVSGPGGRRGPATAIAARGHGPGRVVGGR
jgi:hypothetical protein